MNAKQHRGRSAGQLATLDCDLAQGYYVNRPADVGAIDDWLAQAIRRTA